MTAPTENLAWAGGHNHICGRFPEHKKSNGGVSKTQSHTIHTT
jgi:hypothetical protein